MEENKLNFDGKIVTKARKGEQVVPRIYLGTDIVFRDYSHYDTYIIYNGTGSGTISFNTIGSYDSSSPHSINGVWTNEATFEHGTELGLIKLKPTGLDENWSIKKFSVPLETTDFTLMCTGFPKDSNLEYLRTDNATDFTYMFRSCKMETMDLSHFITDNVLYMRWTFQYCENLTELDVSTWNTANVIDMRHMFKYCYLLEELDLSSFDTSKVTHMVEMFCDCKSLREVDLSSFNTSNVTHTNSMFENCSSLQSLNLSHFDTSNVEYMNDMFRNCNSLTSLDISNFNTSKITDMSYMFLNCSSLKTLDLSSFNTSSVTDMHSMFNTCSSLETLDLRNFDTSNVTKTTLMFYDVSDCIIYVGEGWTLSTSSGAYGGINLTFIRV